MINSKDGTTVTWNFITETIVLHNPRKGLINNDSIPWFEPDLSDYRALIKKLKIYVTFL